MSNKNKNKLVQVTYTRPVRKLGIGDWKMGNQTLNDAFKGEGASWMGEAGSALGTMANSVISNGLESGAGNFFGTVGNIGSNIPGPWGAAIAGGSQVLGGVANRLFGSSLNQEHIDEIKNQTSLMNSTLANISDWDSLQQAMNNATQTKTFEDDYIGKDGTFSDTASDLANKLRTAYNRANNRQYVSFATNVDNIGKNTLRNLLSKPVAYGGPLFAYGGNLYDNGGAAKMSKDALFQEAFYDYLYQVANANYENWGLSSPEEALDYIAQNPNYDYASYFANTPTEDLAYDEEYDYWPEQYKKTNKTAKNQLDVPSLLNADLTESDDDAIYYASGGAIHINPKNKGKFTEAAKRAGMGVQEYASHVLANKGQYSSTLVKRANFARNAARWHADGGFLNEYNSFADGGDMNGEASAIRHKTWYDYDYDNAVDHYHSRYNVRGKQLENLVQIKKRLDDSNLSIAAKKAVLQTMYRESSFRPEVVNSLGYKGLLQWGGEGRSPKDWQPTVDYQIDYFLKTMDSQFMPAYIPDKKITKSSQVAEMFRNSEDPELAMYLLAASHQRNGVNKRIATKQGISMAKTGAWNNTDFELDNNYLRSYYGNISYHDYLRKAANENYKTWKFDNAEQAYQHMLNDNSYDYRDYYENTPHEKLVYNAEDHWPDTYKTAYHPTFSDESKYSGIVSDANPLGIQGGTWDGDTFTPSQDQMLTPDAYFYMNGTKPQAFPYPYILKSRDEENSSEDLLNNINPTLIGIDSLQDLTREEELPLYYTADPDALYIEPPTVDLAPAQSATGSSWGHALNKAGIPMIMNSSEYRVVPRFQKFGGELNTQGADFTNGLTAIDAGGTHEENPLQGVPMGTDNEGTPNLVEEGETIYNDYVFSRRLILPKDLRSRYGFSSSKEVSFAEVSKKIAEESEERPNDPISQRGLEVLMGELIQLQEMVKNQQREQQQEQMAANSINKFSGPETESNDLDEPNTSLLLDQDAIAKRWQYISGHLNDSNVQDFLSNFNNTQSAENQIDFTGLDENTLSSYLTESDDSYNKDLYNYVYGKDNLISAVEPEVNFERYPEWLRYSPAAAYGIGAITDALGITNKPNNADANSLRRAARNRVPQYIGYPAAGTMLTYKPYDRLYQANLINAQANAARRAILQNAGLSRSGMAGILAADKNTLSALNQAYAQGLESNNSFRRQVANNNNGVLQTWGENALKAAASNQSAYDSASNESLRYLAQAYKMRKQEADAIDAAKSTNLTGLAQSLGDIGLDNLARNWATNAAMMGVFENGAQNFFANWPYRRTR